MENLDGCLLIGSNEFFVDNGDLQLFYPFSFHLANVFLSAGV